MRHYHGRLLTKFLSRIIFTVSRLFEGATSGDSPVGRSRERLPAALARNQPRGRCRPKGRGEKCRGGAPRGETSRSQGTLRRLASVFACLASTQRVPRKHPAPSRRSASLPRQRGIERKDDRDDRAARNGRRSVGCLTIEYVSSAGPRSVSAFLPTVREIVLACG